MVAVTGMGIEFSNRSRDQVVDDVAEDADQVLAAADRRGRSDGRRSQPRARLRLRAREPREEDGRPARDRALLAWGVDSGMKKLSAVSCAAQYRLTYATLPGLKSRKLEVKVARPGVKVQIGVQQVPGPLILRARRVRGRLASRAPSPRAGPCARQAPRAAPDLRGGHRGHQPQRVRHRRPEPLRDRPPQEGLRGVRGRHPPGAVALHPRGPADLARPADRHVGLDGREAAGGPRGGHRASSRPCAPRTLRR